MSLRMQSESGLRTLDRAVPPHDSSEVMPVGELPWPDTGGEKVDEDLEAARRSRSLCVHSFTRETVDSHVERSDEAATAELSGPDGSVDKVSSWNDERLWTGIKDECEEIRLLDSHYPGRYHRLGTLILEAHKRFGDEATRQVLRQEGIDSTRAWRAEQIARLYTYEQATGFPSLRAILGTLPAKQPRVPKSKQAGGEHEPSVLHHTPQCSSVSAPSILESFVQIGIEIKATLGDEAFDQAVEQIRAHVAESLEDLFVEVK